RRVHFFVGWALPTSAANGGQCPPYEVASGSVIVAVVPLPTTLSTFTCPPCISTNFFTTLAPSPNPRLPCSYVPDECLATSYPVKNASPYRFNSASSIPQPVSAMLI